MFLDNNQLNEKNPPSPSPHKPPHKPHPHKKIDIKHCKDNTINSLFEVENFLGNFHNILKYIKLYKILK